MTVKWTESEKEMLEKMSIPFDYKGDLDNNQIDILYEMIPDYMLDFTDTSDDRPSSDFNICEDIITKLAEAMKSLGLI